LRIGKRDLGVLKLVGGDDERLEAGDVGGGEDLSKPKLLLVADFAMVIVFEVCELEWG
jgi:hypothetical protein